MGGGGGEWRQALNASHHVEPLIDPSYIQKNYSLSLSLSLSLTHTLTYTLTHAIELLRQKQWKKEFHYLLSRQMNSNKRKSNDLISIPEKNPR